MSDTKTSGLSALGATPATGDLFMVVDVSDTTMAATGTNKYLVASYVVSLDRAETLTNKTLTTPVIGDFTNAGHSHTNSAGGGQLDHGAALTGLGDDDHTQYLLATGARTGASSQAQTFTNGIIGPTWKPASDSTTALLLQNAAASSNILTVDTTNARLGIWVQPSAPLHIYGSAGEIRSQSSLTDATQKSARFTIGHYTNAEEPLAGFIGTSDVTNNTILFGGGSGIANAATQMIFYLAANNTTTTGTAVVYYTVNGMFVGGTTPPTALVHIGASTTARASLCKAHGTAPTSPVNGDEWTTTSGSFVRINGTTKTYVTVSSPATYTPSNVTTDRAYDANATTLDEVADVLGTLIADLKLTGIIL